ncbi:fumarylacetoacetate hydrolase family protein [Shewanella japonica]|uniref:fumarylacetoacetate hydrolase family protein n=1 Tax=Shewanella japonica TaxID=93973 RepID=UPI000E742E0E|nr:fumarylacetoacetate hydrolase family protein [Shewanella japonica]
MLNTIQYDSNSEATSPSKIICIGRNYVDHIHELGNEVPSDMVVFLKPNSAISTQLISFHQEPIHFETELCFSVRNGMFHGVGVGLDLTKRELQSKLKSQQLPWERAKAFDGSALFSDFVSLSSLSLTAGATFCFQLTIDGEVRQLGHSDLMMYSADDILASVNEFMTLVDGDIVMTGTPKGVGQVALGTVFEIKLWANVDYSSQEQLAEQVSQIKPCIEHRWTAV